MLPAPPGGENGNGNGARMREIALSQLVWLVSIVIAVVSAVGIAVWGVATWSRSLETSWEQPLAAMRQELASTQGQMRQDLAQTQAILAGQRGVVEAQQRTLSTLVDFMNQQTTARRAAGEREGLRKELCTAGALTGERCLNLPSDGELEALKR